MPPATGCEGLLTNEGRFQARHCLVGATAAADIPQFRRGFFGWTAQSLCPPAVSAAAPSRRIATRISGPPAVETKTVFAVARAAADAAKSSQVVSSPRPSKWLL